MTTMITAISEERCNDSFLYEELSVARPVVAPKHADSINFIAESPEQIFRQNVASRKHAQQLVEATEDIRRHIARELHDDIGQRLSLLSIRLGLLQQLHAVEDPDNYLAKSLRDLDILISDVHDLSHSLHSSRIEHLGLCSALHEIFNRFRESYGTHIDFFEGNIPDELPPCFALCFFRIAQESVSNAIKHGRALNIRVAFTTHDDVLTLHVQDFGIGFDKNLVKEGLGLITMGERMAAIGGTLTVKSELDIGTVVIAVANLLP